MNILEQIVSDKNSSKLTIREVIGFKIQSMIDQKIREELAAKLAAEEEERKRLEAEQAAAEAADQDNVS